MLVYWSQPGMGLPVPATEGYSTCITSGRDWRVYTHVQGTHALQVAHSQDERRGDRHQDRAAHAAAVRGAHPAARRPHLGRRRPWPRAAADDVAAVAKRTARRDGAARRARPAGGAAAAGRRASTPCSRASTPRWRAQRRFTADAAHELRTPLAALKLQLDLARARASILPRAQRAFDDLEAGVERAAHLVDQLLTMARLEPEALGQPRRSTATSRRSPRDAIVARAPLAADKRRRPRPRARGAEHQCAAIRRASRS